MYGIDDCDSWKTIELFYRWFLNHAGDVYHWAKSHNLYRMWTILVFGRVKCPRYSGFMKLFIKPSDKDLQATRDCIHAVTVKIAGNKLHVVF